MTVAHTANNRSDVSKPEPLDRIDLFVFFVLAFLTAVLRIVNRGPLYFVDGPRLVWSIQQHFYVIQPPGYFTLAHLGALFPDPAFGLAFWAVTFSSLGAGVFYLLCRLRRSERYVCFLAAFAYVSVYYVWFAGEIHSSYASQILFPALGLFCFFRYQATGSFLWAIAWATAAACGMALRPSDGVFLVPLWLYLLVRYVRDVQVWTSFAAINIALYLGWYIPTQHALKFSHQGSTESTILVSMQTVSPLLTGINGRSLANLARVFLPPLIALWALMPAVFSKRRSADNRLAAFWAFPGLCFFALCYMADPTYLTFLTGAAFWLVVTAFHSRRATICLAVCLLFNCGLFIFARSVSEAGLTHRLANFYVVKYTRYGLQHRWSSTVGDGARVP